MAKKDLLAEAIADARKVKETALANAKMALEEAFQPTLRNMISSRIAEEEGDDDGDEFSLDIDIQPEEPEMEAEPVASDAVAPEGDDLDGGEPLGMGSFEDGEDDVDGDEEPNTELESLFRELEGDDDEFLGEGEEEDWQDPIPDDPMFENDGYDDEFKSGDNELTEAEINALASLFEEEGLGDIDGPENEDGGSYTHAGPSATMNYENRKLRNANKQLRKELSEAYNVVTRLKTTINEVNLLNAKLMYTTKAFKAGNLNESQQIKVMQAIDRANTVREVKLVYTSILEALNGKSRKLVEGYASKPSKAMNPKKSLTESKNSDVIKWQRLAGILPPADY